MYNSVFKIAAQYLPYIAVKRLWNVRLLGVELTVITWQRKCSTDYVELINQQIPGQRVSVQQYEIKSTVNYILWQYWE